MEDTLAPENTEQLGMDNTRFSGIRAAHLGEKIRAIRRTQSMKQDTLAQLVKVTQSKISAIESTGEVDARTLKRIADALEVSVDFIKRFEAEEAVYQVQNNYMSSAQTPTPQVGEFDQSTDNSITNELDVIKHMSDTIKESYTVVIAEQKEIIRELKAEIKELRAKK